MPVYWTDAGGDNNGEIHGNVLIMRDPARGPVLEFFGTPDSYVEVPKAAEFDLNSYTVMFWMQAYDIGRKQAVFSHGESFESDFPPGTDDQVHDDEMDKAQYIIYLKEDGHLQHWSESAGEDQGSWGAHRATETDFYSSSDFQLRERIWVHVAVTRGEDNAVQFYINGELDSHHEPEDGFNDPHFMHVLTFGARTQGNGRYQNWFTGTLDDLVSPQSGAWLVQVHKQSVFACDSWACSDRLLVIPAAVLRRGQRRNGRPDLPRVVAHHVRCHGPARAHELRKPPGEPLGPSNLPLPVP